MKIVAFSIFIVLMVAYPCDGQETISDVCTDLVKIPPFRCFIFFLRINCVKRCVERIQQKGTSELEDSLSQTTRSLNKPLISTGFFFLRRTVNCEDQPRSWKCIGRANLQAKQSALQQFIDRINSILFGSTTANSAVTDEVTTPTSTDGITSRDATTEGTPTSETTIQSTAGTTSTNGAVTDGATSATITDGTTVQDTTTEGTPTSKTTVQSTAGITSTNGAVTDGATSTTITDGTTAQDTSTEGTFASETTAQSTAETTSAAATSTRCENYLSIHRDSAQINKMLAAHNEKRRLFNAGNVNAENGIFPQAASTIPDLKWNSDLADLAQAHSKKCKFEHSKGNSLPDFSYIGENLYTSSGSDSCDTLPDWSNAVAPWYSEIDDFASQDQICNVGRTYVHQPSPALGHFTQIIWQKTTDIGCGIAACVGGSIIITCNYGPGGNFGNQPVYEFGTCPPPA